jgi:hypothetical protein
VACLWACVSHVCQVSLTGCISVAIIVACSKEYHLFAVSLRSEGRMFDG